MTHNTHLRTGNTPLRIAEITKPYKNTFYENFGSYQKLPTLLS